MLVIFVLGGVASQNNIDAVEDAWYSFQESRSEKASAFNSIAREIGYGGMIHHFKNYILRQEPRLVKAVLGNIHSARSAVVAYERLEIDVEEQAAVHAIRETLMSYEDALSRAGHLIERGRKVQLIDQDIRINDKPALDALALLRNYAKPRSRYGNADFATKTSLLNALRRAMGYGGMIHDFKNYIIREEEPLYSKVQSHLKSVRGLVSQYRKQALDSKEVEALRTLLNVVENYAKGLATAKAMNGSGSTPVEVDSAVRVYDGPALAAFEVLSKAISANENAHAHLVQQRFQQLRNLVQIQFAAELALSILIISSLSWLLWKQVISPIRRLTQSMNNLATGDLNIALPAQTRQNEVGDMSRALSVFRDAAIQQEKDRKILEVARQEAEAANRAKSEFLSSMSHELRTPLNAVLGFGQLLEDPDNPLNEGQKESMTHILNGGAHLLKLINEILDLAKIESGKVSLSIEVVSVRSIVDSCMVMANALGEKYGISVHGTLDRFSPLTVLADMTRSKQVLLNLLSNAVKYNREGGTVSLDVEAMGDGMIRFSVTDTGLGVPERDQDALFAPFSRLANGGSEIEGTGIGLTITKQLVEQMNGRIGVESKVGKGSTFWFELPIADEPTAEAQGDESMPLALAMATTTEQLPRTHDVLYIEDNPANVELMQMTLKRAPNLELSAVGSAELGLERVREKKPDLVLMDIDLPGMSGIEACARLKEDETTADIPVIAVCANAMPHNLAAAKDVGFVTYIAKPYQVAELLEAISKALDNGVSAVAKPVQAPDEETLVDMLEATAIDRIRNSMAVLPARYKDNLNNMLQSLPHLQTEMLGALEKGDMPALEMAAHNYRSRSATLGAMNLSVLAMHVENMARSNEIGGLPAVFSDMDKEYRRTKPAMEQLIA